MLCLKQLPQIGSEYKLIFSNQFSCMKKLPDQRRRFIKNICAGAGALYLPALATSQKESPAQKKKIVCVGGHPDDPESGCGGTLAKFAAAGHEVTIIYLTTGEAGIEGKS